MVRSWVFWVLIPVYLFILFLDKSCTYMVSIWRVYEFCQLDLCLWLVHWQHFLVFKQDQILTIIDWQWHYSTERWRTKKVSMGPFSIHLLYLYIEGGCKFSFIFKCSVKNDIFCSITSPPFHVEKEDSFFSRVTFNLTQLHFLQRTILVNKFCWQLLTIPGPDRRVSLHWLVSALKKLFFVQWSVLGN